MWKHFFRPPRSQIDLVKEETTQIDKESLKLVESAAQDVDSLLQAAANEALTGHQYLNIVVKGRAQTGDVFSSDWKGKVIGSSHIYDGIEIEKERVALVVNKYGGKDFLGLVIWLRFVYVIG
jgi:hypothetical protein